MLLTLAVIFFIVGLILMIAVPLYNKFGTKEPEIERKWTDPSLRRKK